MANHSGPLIKQGWIRALLFIIGLFTTMFFLEPLSRLLLAQLAGGAEPSINDPANFLVMYAITGIAMLLITFGYRRIVDRATFVSLGFAWKGFTNEAWLGFFTGPAILGIGSIILVLAGYIGYSAVEWSAPSFVIAIAAMILVAFVEETIFRGYVLNNLMSSCNKWVALAISALLFGLVHGVNPGVSLLAVTNIFIAGVFLGINYIYTRNLWFSIFFHFSWNFFQGPVFGYQVSGLQLPAIFQQSQTGPEWFTGGSFGFEGSLLCALLLIVFLLLYNRLFAKQYGAIDPVALPAANKKAPAGAGAAIV
ncbi:CPBP family intramembrane metalloprotease [Segetibacter sp. 3557_3]|uniref:CPBP family intramembrane glutamic endopeptidase n=1 Tax=Segetibacter sp. 3557_3 TaxID=2547429 RepID=UPI0010585174|nr:type II CAAX endopeptidase family protein [Segetibacter sp. 3557_3]TDH26496.1 CPBP family intramembrane metalloprotease [Segetibacter sp. 3557_3]